MRRLAGGVAVRRPRRADDGTILILSLGFCAIALLLVYAVVAASAVFLARRDLAAAVDGTALAAAQQVSVHGVYQRGVYQQGVHEQGTGAALPLDRGAVRAAIERYVGQAYPPAQYPAQTISGDTTADLRAVVVHGERTVRLPVFGHLTVHADSTAVSAVER